jgi:lysophospholipase L1-like esterase
MSRSALLLFTFLLLTLGCSPTDDDVVDCSDGSYLDSVQLSGLLYVDADESDGSIHDNSFDSDSDTPIAGSTVRLFGDTNLMVEGRSCADGNFHFGDLSAGAYVVAPELDVDGNCMQRNCTKRFPQAIAEGSVKIVTMGDSVPVQGDPVRFPARLATLLGDIADITNTNVAVGGTVSSQWLPGTSHFDNRLTPELADADVVVMSIGGNDIMASLDVEALLDPEGTIEATYELVQQIAENVRSIVDGMREINADIDVVYCIYVDYGQAGGNWNIIGNMVGQEAITSVLRTARESLSVEEDILIADLFGASHELEDPLSDYLADMLHFNDRGHSLYAEEIFLTLGGALIGDSSLGGQSRDNIGLSPTWSLAPE